MNARLSMNEFTSCTLKLENKCVSCVYFLHEKMYIFVIKVNFRRGSIMKKAILDAAKRNGDMLTTAQAVRYGISKTMLAKYVEQNKLIRVRHGLYALPDSIIDDVFALYLQNPNIVFSHESALFLNGLAERTPFKQSVTVPSNRVLPKPVKEQCSCFYIRPIYFKLGLTRRKTTFGNDVPCYDAERTVCDIVRSRRRIDEETVVAAIKNYARSVQKDLFKLYEYSTTMSIYPTIKQYMEVLI